MTPLEPASAPEDVADGFPIKSEDCRAFDDPPPSFSSSSPVVRCRDHARPASVSQPAPWTSDLSQLAPAGDDTGFKRQQERPRKAPAPGQNADSVLRPPSSVLTADAQSAADSEPRPPPSASDPQWQPWIPLRRVDDDGERAQTRPSETADARGHTTGKPEVARPRAVTRSGRSSRPPSLFGLRGDEAD